MQVGVACKDKHECSGRGDLTPGPEVPSREKHVQERLQTKGRTPVKVERMRPFLGRYPDRAAAQLLEVGFFGWL